MNNEPAVIPRVYRCTATYSDGGGPCEMKATIAVRSQPKPTRSTRFQYFQCCPAHIAQTVWAALAAYPDAHVIATIIRPRPELTIKKVESI